MNAAEVRAEIAWRPGMVAGGPTLHGGAMHTDTTAPTKPRYLPVEIAPETWVIHDTMGEDGSALVSTSFAEFLAVNEALTA